MATEFPKVKTECVNDSELCSKSIQHENSYELSFYNNTAHVLTVDFSYTALNYDVAHALTQTFTIAPAETVPVFETYVNDVNAYSELTWNSTYEHGDFEATHDDDYIYTLPYQAGEEYLVSQGFNGAYSHSEGANQYSVDFVMDAGTPILAARAGKVVKVAESSSLGGTSSFYYGKANFVVIEQSDGTHAEYFHLKQYGALVEVGDLVEVGQKIGLSGNTGFSSGPHLHFSITSPVSGSEMKSYPFAFEAFSGVVTEPLVGFYYTSVTELYTPAPVDSNIMAKKKSSSSAGSVHWLFLMTLGIVLLASKKRRIYDSKKKC